MGNPKTWLLLVDHNFEAIGDRFSVRASDEDDMEDLKKNVKKERQDDLAHINAARLTVWRTKGDMVINKSAFKRLEEILGSINVDDKDTIEKLSADEQVADLGLSGGETLLVQLPDVHLDRLLNHRIASEVDSEYEVCFLKARSKRDFIQDDLDLNEIVDVGEERVPKFVEEYKKMLGRKRKVADNLGEAAEMVVCEATRNEYFTLSMEDDFGSVPIVDQRECSHLCYISSASWARLWRSNVRFFKEADANMLFFYAIADHFDSLGTEKFAVKLGQQSWPFSLVVQVDHEYYSYKPKSDFLVLKSGLPRVAVEVNSIAPGRNPADLHRLMLQGASVVRFANTFLDTYKNKKNFVFVAIFVRGDGVADRYILYQKEGFQKVYCKRRNLELKDERSRARFALELYNLSSVLDNESQSEDPRENVEKLTAHVEFLKKEYKLPTFTGKSKRPAGDDEGNQPGPSVRRKGDGGGAIEQLEACGYEVVPDIFETDGGTWELLSKPPPHIRTVYRQGDRNKTELIAKHVREGSNELDIFKYLQTIQPQSPHVISLIETIPPITREWLILPKLRSLCDERFMSSGGVRGRDQLGWGLIKGLAYLHEHKVAHRDVKPSNLVCDNGFRLQIIDFDVAIVLQEDDTEIDEYRGTKDWTAPEMGEQDGPTPMYSPIKADRWSCGRVLIRHIMVGKGDNRLSKFADQLMANDPQQRPSLLKWDKWFAPPFSDVANVLKDDGKEASRPRQDTVEVDGESMKPPATKKPRLAVNERDVRPELYGLQAS